MFLIPVRIRSMKYELRNILIDRYSRAVTLHRGIRPARAWSERVRFRLAEKLLDIGGA